MSDRWAGIKVGYSTVYIVGLDLSCSPASVIRDFHFELLTESSRVEGYAQAYKRIADFLDHDTIKKVAIVSSAVNPRSKTLEDLEAAELRGVVLVAAIQSGARVSPMNMSVVNRTAILGDRPTKEYLTDDAFWLANVSGKLNKYNRDGAAAAMAACIQERAR